MCKGRFDKKYIPTPNSLGIRQCYSAFLYAKNSGTVEHFLKTLIITGFKALHLVEHIVFE